MQNDRQEQAHVDNIARNLTDPSTLELNGDGEETSAFDYLTDALDIEYRVGSDGKYRSARILVAFGGPNIWIDTGTNTVELYWYADHAEARFDDNLGLDDACRELWECR